ncbi:MAG: CopG family transcriptional regulator [Peptococcaceae bacterium]|nr:CopG family transcriptional regulator [Peptococcaceae bacterium]NLM20356.1 CopG family transcriptional regulator [Peptococcaceae bacterium]
MAETRRIVVCLPENIIEEVDDIVSMEKRDRSDFIKEAIYSVLLERRKAGLREQMRQGYLEMAQINLTLAKDLCQAEEEATIRYERKLAWSGGYEY